MSVVKIYTTDNILGRAIQSYIKSILDNVFTLGSSTFVLTEPSSSTDVIFINLISSQISPLTIIKHINTMSMGGDNMNIAIIVDSNDVIIYKNILLNKNVVILDLNAPLSAYNDALNKRFSISDDLNKNNRLTRKERTVFSFLLIGCSILDISKRLRCDSKTIYTHRANIIKKMNLKNTMKLNESIARLNDAG